MLSGHKNSLNFNYIIIFRRKNMKKGEKMCTFVGAPQITRIKQILNGSYNIRNFNRLTVYYCNFNE